MNEVNHKLKSSPDTAVESAAASPYKNPPITESIAEFSFTSDLEDMTGFLVEFYKMNQDRFPIRKPIRSKELFLDMGESGGTPIVKELPDGIRLESSTHNFIMLVRPSVFSIHRIGYSNLWGEFLTLIMEIYRSVVDMVPNYQLTKATLRYLNTFTLDEPEVHMGKYFEASLLVPPGLPLKIELFTKHLDFIYEDTDSVFKQMMLRYILANAPRKPGEDEPYKLDLAAMTTQTSDIAYTHSNLEEWLHLAHKRIIDAFEASFTDYTKENVFLKGNNDE